MRFLRFSLTFLLYLFLAYSAYPNEIRVGITNSESTNFNLQDVNDISVINSLTHNTFAVSFLNKNGGKLGYCKFLLNTFEKSKFDNSWIISTTSDAFFPDGTNLGATHLKKSIEDSMAILGYSNYSIDILDQYYIELRADIDESALIQALSHPVTAPLNGTLGIGPYKLEGDSNSGRFELVLNNSRRFPGKLSPFGDDSEKCPKVNLQKPFDKLRMPQKLTFFMLNEVKIDAALRSYDLDVLIIAGLTELNEVDIKLGESLIIQALGRRSIFSSIYSQFVESSYLANRIFYRNNISENFGTPFLKECTDLQQCINECLETDKGYICKLKCTNNCPI